MGEGVRGMVSHNSAVAGERLLTAVPPPTDYSHGFGGKFGVQKDRMDKVHVLALAGEVGPRSQCVATGWHRPCLAHQSQWPALCWTLS